MADSGEIKSVSVSADEYDEKDMPHINTVGMSVGSYEDSYREPQVSVVAMCNENIGENLMMIL